MTIELETENRLGPEEIGTKAPAGGPESPATVIRPPSGWQLINVKELWQFRELLGFLAWRDVKVRYKQTLLGAAWAILQPLMMMVVFTIFFGRMAGVSSGDLPYPLFAFAGLLPWTFFATAITNAGNSVVGSERLITKIYFPRLTVPFAAVAAAMVDFGVALGMLVVLMLWYGIVPGMGLLIIPIILGGITLLALGVGTLLAALNVAYRDFRYVIPFMVQLWMFATPTVYMQPAERGGDGESPEVASVSGEKQSLGGDGNLSSGSGRGRSGVRQWVHLLLVANPMTGLIGAFRAAALGSAFAWDQLLTSLACAISIAMLGCLYFRKVEDSFADVI